MGTMDATMNTMKSSIGKAIEELRTAETELLVENAANNLARFGSHAVAPLIALLQSNAISSGVWQRGLIVLKKIGYPDNEAAIDEVINVLMDPNSPGWEIALDILEAAGEPVYLQINDLFQNSITKAKQFPLSFLGLCALLQRWGSPTIDPLAPELTYLFLIGTEENNLDWYCLGPLQLIGSPKASPVVPAIGERLLSRRKEAFRYACLKALAKFDLSIVRAVADALNQCLSDSSPRIRDEADKLLNQVANNM